MIRKIQFAPASNKEGPKTEITKQFMMNDKPVQLEASLGKEVRQNLCSQERGDHRRGIPGMFPSPSLLSTDGKPLLKIQIYYHGDPITVNVKINNGTSKVVKKIKVTGEVVGRSESTFGL